MKRNIRTPLFVVNPKAYLYGEGSLPLALEADRQGFQKHHAGNSVSTHVRYCTPERELRLSFLFPSVRREND